MSAGAVDRHETMVRVYKKPDEYQRDAQRLAAQGWIVANTMERRPRAGCARILTLGLFTLVFPPKPELVITYSRVVGSGTGVASALEPQFIACPQCGGPVPVSAQFCPSCGLKRYNPPS